MKKNFLLSLLLFFTLSCAAQNEIPREFRAAWVATVANIDWPSSKNLTTEQQQQEIITLFDVLKQNNFNAVIVQVRPAADAFYNSPFEPWSRYLTGTQGKAPSPYYDPLQFMIAEAHKRCLEFHAWFNPYRALMSTSSNPNPPEHITRTHPEWFVDYGGKRYFNPGLPAVQDYCVKIVTDVVKRYDIDAVHMDDYFYPYRIGKTEFPDGVAFSAYNSKKLSRDDWRRDNVNTLIARLNREIKQLKPFVKFGISPFGVWRNANKDPERGSATKAGQTNYDDLFADVLLWQEKGWIDYLLPQLYWETGHAAADFATLIRWWNKNAFERHMYIGHGIYRLGNKQPAWQNLNELEHQIAETRRYPNIHGSAFYSAKFLLQNTMGINQMFMGRTYTTPALLPQASWLPKQQSNLAAVRLQISYDHNGAKLLKWTNERKQQFAIYEIKNTKDNYSKKLLAVTREDRFVVTKKGGTEEYGVAPLDRLHNEGPISNLVN